MWRFMVTLCLMLLCAVVGGAVVADGPVAGRVGRAEVRFLEGMIDHHQMALDMANDCLARATTEAVLTTCQNIIDAQTPEIATMQDWLLRWYNIAYAPVPMMSDEAMPGMDHGDHSMGGMDMGAAATAEPASDPAMTMGMFAGLNRLEGQEYDAAWLEAMIDHHDDAVHMAKRLLQRDSSAVGHAELREMAQKIITDQTAEIDLMGGMLSNLPQ